MALISSMEAFSTPLLHGVPPACAAKLSGGCPLPPTGPWGANASLAGPLGRGGARLLCHGHGYISHRLGSRAWVWYVSREFRWRFEGSSAWLPGGSLLWKGR